jgi:hypothetical protein
LQIFIFVFFFLSSSSYLACRRVTCRDPLAQGDDLITLVFFLGNCELPPSFTKVKKRNKQKKAKKKKPPAYSVLLEFGYFCWLQPMLFALVFHIKKNHWPKPTKKTQIAKNTEYAVIYKKQNKKKKNKKKKNQKNKKTKNKNQYTKKKN